MTFVRTLLLPMLLALVLVGCGPQIETRYNYQPPNTNAGMACVQQCEQNRQYCRSSEQVAYQNCRAQAMQQAEMEYRQYLYSLRRGQKPERSLSSFDRSYQCSSREGQCKLGYNECYAGCGGQVTEQRFCVAGCDQMKPPVAPFTPVGPALVNGMPVAQPRQPAAARPQSTPMQAAPQMAAVEVRSLAPQYRLKGTNDDGSTYGGTVKLVAEGNRYRITWDIDGDIYRGVGTLSGNRLIIDSKLDGKQLRSEMTVGADGRLTGPWETEDDSGTEEWTPR